MFLINKSSTHRTNALIYNATVSDKLFKCGLRVDMHGTLAWPVVLNRWSKSHADDQIVMYD